MTEGKNPEDKPSFFDFSEEEARSWPPANSYETEDETDVPETAAEQADVEELDIDDLYKEEASIPEEPATPIIEPEAVKAEEETKLPETGGKYVDMLFTDFGSFDGMELSPEEQEQQDILIPIIKQKEAEPEKPNPAIAKPAAEVPPASIPVVDKHKEKEEKEALDAILGAQPEKATKKAPVETKKSEDFDVDSMFSSPSKTEPDEESTETDTGIGNTIEEYDVNSILEEDDSISLPFRTYSTFDYNDETLTEASLDEAEEKQGLKLNRNILIVLSVLLLVGGWLGFKSLFNRKIPGVTNARKRKPPKKEQKSLIAISRELIPVWEITSQKSISKNEERTLVNDIYNESGRDNPFVVPDSVLADLKRAADAEIVNTQKPKTYRRKAYRATLVGVLTSKDNTIALINYQEAVFDVLEGTSRPKIIKLGTKAMDKAKANTQEMVIGSYIGPWQITKMDSPKDAFTEARVYLSYQGQTKTLSMGRAEELGIFDDTGTIDNLDSPTGDDEAASDDDFEF